LRSIKVSFFWFCYWWT